MLEHKNAVRLDRGALESALRDAGAVFKGRAILCPFHEDRSPSGSVYRGEDGVWRFKCHGCSVCEDVVGVRALASNRTAGDVLKGMNPAAPDPPAKRPPPEPKDVFATIAAMERVSANREATFVYTHPDTRAAEMVVFRLAKAGGGKSFSQASPVDGGFAFCAPPKPWPLYNRTRVRAAPVVVVVEGEKCVHALAVLGVVATTSPGGAENGHNADWSPLAGKAVYLWPDHDEKGAAHMRKVLGILAALADPPVVQWIEPARWGIPHKGDVVEFLEPYASAGADTRRAAVHEAMEQAQPTGAAAELRALMEDTIAGKRQPVEWPWLALGRFSQALLPGTVTCLCGDPGSTKSFLLLEAAWHWHRAGVRVALYELEEDRAYHLSRALAQLAGNSELTDAGWVKANPVESREAFDAHRDFLEGFGACVSAAPDEQNTLADLARWVEERAAAGCRVVAIDPITAAATSDKPWVDDLKFLMAVKASARKHACSVVLVTHPRKGRKTGSGLDDLSGGAAFPRFSQAVFWIEKHDVPKGVRVQGRFGANYLTINRSLFIRKARNGRGAGRELGFFFDPKTLRFSEQGVVIGKDAQAEHIGDDAPVTPRPGVLDVFGDVPL